MSASTVTNMSSSTKTSSRRKKKKRSTKAKDTISCTSSIISSSTNKSKVREVDFDNRTSLYCSIVKRDWDGASKRCQMSPDEASTWIVTKGMKGSNLRFLPLHKACVLQPPSMLLESLISAYPDGVWCEDHDGWLPLHCAAYTGANQDLIETLLLANPAGSRAKDQKGLLPIHYACMKGAGRGVIAPLLQYYPESIFCADENNRWPTHYAITKGHVESLEAVLSISGSEALSTKEGDTGRMLLHYACVEDADDEIVSMLINHYPHALKEKDIEGNLPIHLVCQYKIESLGVIDEMLRRYPEAINIENQMGHTPLECVQTTLNHPIKHPTIDFIRKLDNELCTMKQNEDETQIPQDKKLPVSITEDLIQQPSTEKAIHNLYFCTNNREIKNQVEGLNQTVETLSIIFQEIATLREEIQTTLAKAKDNRIAFQSLSEQLLDIKSLQQQPTHQPTSSSVSESSSPVDDEDESVSDSSSASIQKLECVKEVVNASFSSNKGLVNVGSVTGEMREDCTDSRANAVLIRE